MGTPRTQPLKEHYGRWTVDDPTAMGAKVWCTCSCGTRRQVFRHKLKAEQSTNCGCLRREQLQKPWDASLAPHHDGEIIPAARFGRWTVLTVPFMEWNESLQYHRRVAQCKCECGTIRNVSADNLLAGDSKSCGCYRRDGARKLASAPK